MSRDTLHGLIDIVDEKELDTVYRVLLKFVTEDKTQLDEKEAINIAKQEIERGEVVSHDMIWD